MSEIDFGDLDISEPHQLKVEEMLADGAVDVGGLAVAFQQVIDENYRQYDRERRQ